MSTVIDAVHYELEFKPARTYNNRVRKGVWTMAVMTRYKTLELARERMAVFVAASTDEPYRIVCVMTRTTRTVVKP